MAILTKNRRNPFNCGHRGYGAYCHRCAEADRLEQATVKTRYISSMTVEQLKTKVQKLRAMQSIAPSATLIESK